MIPPGLFDTSYGRQDGSDDGYLAANFANLRSFSAKKLVPRVLTGDTDQVLSTTVLGTRIDLPVVIAPTGSQRRFHPEGELAAARAAARMGTVYGLSMLSHCSLKEVSDAGGDQWFQLYYLSDRDLDKQLIERAEEAGYKALVVTVDNMKIDSRERLARSGGGPATGVIPWRNLLDLIPDQASAAGDYYHLVDKSMSWRDVEWLRSATSLPVIVKKIQSAADAKTCAEVGASGLVVSNHGGHTYQRSLRGTLDTLLDVTAAVAGSIEVYMDGGVRTGDDVLKALACGARAVLIGRAMMWGLTVGGEEGVVHVLEILRDELLRSMRICGVASVESVPADLVVPE